MRPELLVGSLVLVPRWGLLDSKSDCADESSPMPAGIARSRRVRCCLKTERDRSCCGPCTGDRSDWDLGGRNSPRKWQLGS